MSEIKKIRIKDIKENPLNESRRTSTEDVENLGSNIRQEGLMDSPVVYLNDDGRTYTLLSGHKRFLAMQEIAGSDGEIDCKVVRKPKNLTKEIETMARLNVHRCKPGDLANEVRIVSDNWKTMDADEKRRWKEKLWLKFEAEHFEDPAFIADPKRVKSQEFRPRLEYIKEVLGIDISSRTLTSFLRKTQEGPILREPTKAAPKKAADEDTILRKVKELIVALEKVYGLTKPTDIAILEDCLINVRNMLEKETE